LWIILAAPALLVAAVGYERAVLPASAWRSAQMGTSWLHCLVLVPAFGLLPLAHALWGIRQGASTRPALTTGFLAGLLAGGLGAALVVWPQAAFTTTSASSMSMLSDSPAERASCLA
jgi:hypothetical protein